MLWEGTNPAAVRGFRKRYSKARFRDDLGTSPAKVFLAGGHLFFFLFLLVGSVSDVSRVCLACVLHALGTKPAAVRGFGKRYPKARVRDVLGTTPAKAFLPGGHLFSFLLVGSVGDVSRVCLACVLHALGTNPAAVRGFGKRYPKARVRDVLGTTPAKAFLPGGHLFSFLLVGSVGDVSRVFLACVSQAFGTNPAAV